MGGKFTFGGGGKGAVGRFYDKKGKSYPFYMFQGGCVFIDHVIGYVVIKHQVVINTTETVKAKCNFDRGAQVKRVVIKGYHTDNEIFNASEFMEDLSKKQKNINFSGDGAKHKNWAAQRAIKTVVTMLRTMLMHDALRCPEDTFPLIFGQWKCIMRYGSTIGSMICSLDYPLL